MTMNDCNKKDSNKNSSIKDHNLPPIRVGTETWEKIQHLKKDSKKTVSSIVRELIENGNIDFNPYGKEIAKDVAELHRKANQYTALVRDDIESVKNDINLLQSCIKDNIINNQRLNLFLDLSLHKLDYIGKQHPEQITICTRILTRKDDIYVNLGNHNSGN